MRKTEVINELSKKTNLPKKTVTELFDGLFEVLEEGLVKEGEVKLLPYGIFKVVERKSRKGKNPQTGEEIIIPARKSVKFVVGKKLRESLN